MNLANEDESCRIDQTKMDESRRMYQIHHTGTESSLGWVNIDLRSFLHNHGNVATKGSRKSGLCHTLYNIYIHHCTVWTSTGFMQTQMTNIRPNRDTNPACQHQYPAIDPNMKTCLAASYVCCPPHTNSQKIQFPAPWARTKRYQRTLIPYV